MNHDNIYAAHPSRLFIWAEGLIFGTLAFWLIWSASLLRIDYYDTWDTIANARFFLGELPHYNNMRAPGMAWLLLPVEWLKIFLGLNYEDLRLDHLFMAFVHLATLLAIYRGINRINSRHWTSLLAFSIAVFSYVFLSYLPFVSHDIAPGVLLLWMLILAREYLHQPSRKLFILLVFIGAIGPLIKHTYALFWAVLLLVFAITALWQKNKTSLKRWTHLLLMASLSAGLVWLGFAWTFSADFSQNNFFLRPYVGLQNVFDQFNTTYSAQRSLYLRNFFAYGSAAMPLSLAGIFLVWRHHQALSASARTHNIDIAIVSLAFWIIMPLLGLREARYLLFLTPLYIVLIAATLRFLPWRWLSLVAALLLLQLFGWPLAHYPWPSALQPLMRPARPFYQGASFVPIIQLLKKNQGPLAVYTPTREAPISMMDDEALPVRGDIFHGIFHLSADHLGQITQRPVSINRDPHKIFSLDTNKKITVIVNKHFAIRQPEPPALCLENGQQQIISIGQLQRAELVMSGLDSVHAKAHSPTSQKLKSAPELGPDCFQLEASPGQQSLMISLAVTNNLQSQHSFPIVQDGACLRIQGFKAATNADNTGMKLYFFHPDIVLRLADQDWRKREMQDPDLCPKRDN